jgi:hypothetical protein
MSNKRTSIDAGLTDTNNDCGVAQKTELEQSPSEQKTEEKDIKEEKVKEENKTNDSSAEQKTELLLEPSEVYVMMTGSRSWSEPILPFLKELIKHVPILKTATKIVLSHGNARGADKMCAFAARQLGWGIREFIPDWDKQGKAAGFIRNQQMLDETRPQVVIGFLDTESNGTMHALRCTQEYARKLNTRLQHVTMIKRNQTQFETKNYNLNEFKRLKL